MLGELISAGANLLSGWMNRSAQEDYNKQQLALAHENMAQQKEFAQHGISWKVQDAIASGLHPLAALGANTTSFSPVTAGGEAPKFDFGSMGQDLSRAAKAMSSAADRERVDEEAGRKLDLEKKGLENDILRSELNSKINRTSVASGQIGPPMPVAARIPLPRPGPPRSADGIALAEDDLKQKQGDAPEQAYSRPFGYYLEHNPWFSDGQTSENRYGDSEVLSTAKAIVNLGADHLYTGYKYLWPDRPRGERPSANERRWRRNY